MSCEQLSLSCLLSNKDVTTISVLIGSNVGSFLLGFLLSFFIFRLFNRRKQTQQSPARRMSFIKIRPESTLYEHPVASKLTAVDNLNSGTVPISPCSLSQTFVRHSLKPPMNMFNTPPSASSENIWKSTARRKEHPLMMTERRPSESDISTVYGGMSVENGADHLNAINLGLVDSETKRRSVGSSSVSRDPARRQSQSTAYTSDSRVPFQIPIAGASAVQDPPAAAANAKESVGSYREYPTRPKRASTKYDVTYPLTRQRTLSSNSLVAEARPSLSTSVVGDGSPKIRIIHPFSSNATFDENASHSHSQLARHPLMPIATVETVSSSAPHSQQTEKENREELSDRQQAASFYQEHATRHLSLPQGAQLMTSPVLPESPSVIGGGDNLDRNDFSFARGQLPSKLR